MPMCLQHIEREGDPVLHKFMGENMAIKRKIIKSNRGPYWIELINPVPIESHFSFYSLETTEMSKDKKFPFKDCSWVAFEGVICSREPKIELGTSITFILHEFDGEHSNGGYLYSRNGTKAELHFSIKKECFFTMCDYIKDGTVKYIRVFGDGLFRSYAAIDFAQFTSCVDESEL